MKSLSFLFCLFITAFLTTRYIAKHNELIELRILAVSLEKELAMKEAEQQRLEMTIARALNPSRLLTIAKKAQYAHLHIPTNEEIIMLEEK